jgi:hypothetical protein
MLSSDAWASVADWSVKTGVPAALGCAIVWYLLAKLVPRIIDTYERSMTQQGEAFRVSLERLESRNEEQRRECTQALRELHETIRHENELSRVHRTQQEEQTRSALSELSHQTHALARAVYELHGERTDDGPIPAGSRILRRRTT